LKSFADTLNPGQKKAVCWGDGPLMVLAGPGSGKTFVITNRVRFLMEERNINPSSILVVTFSRAAAAEMEERFRKLMQEASSSGEKSGMPSFGTFHSFFFGILKKAYGYAANQVVSDEERFGIICTLIRENRLESGDMKTFASDLLSEIASVKENRAELENYYSVNCPADVFREIFRSYEKAIGEARKIDYEDMLLMTYDLLKQRQDIRGACSEKYRYILVDEFQDINRLQYEIIRMLAGERANLTVVGDDDQSIYRFRGANPDIMLGFQKDYPQAGQVLLDINYRSTPEIISASEKLIGNNRKRFPKKFLSSHAHGSPVKITVCADPFSEAKHVTDRIKSLREAGVLYGDMAVLYRTNIQPRMVSDCLMASGIPFEIREMPPDLMEHWIAKDFISYLSLARGTGTRRDLVRIVNRPNRYVSRDALLTCQDAEALKHFYADKVWMADRMNHLGYDLRALTGMSVTAAIAYIRTEIGYDAFLSDYAEAYGIEKEELMETANEIADSAYGFRMPEEWISHCAESRSSLQKKHNGHAAGDAVHLMTFHASKGLEFPYVFLIDANEGITPYRKAKTEADTEEERRMFYVAMTRARKELEICTCRRRFRREADPSVFLNEISMNTAGKEADKEDK